MQHQLHASDSRSFPVRYGAVVLFSNIRTCAQAAMQTDYKDQYQSLDDHPCSVEQY